MFIYNIYLFIYILIYLFIYIPIVDFETFSLKIDCFFSISAFEFGWHGKEEEENSINAGQGFLCCPGVKWNLILRNLPVLLFASLKTV